MLFPSRATGARWYGMPARPASDKPPLRTIYRALHRRWGPQHWWPARTRFEVVVGAILTQNTAWTNVTRALAALRRARALTPRALANLPQRRLAALIRPAGTYQVKARRLHAFTRALQRDHGGSLDRLLRRPAAGLRAWLLAVHGIGPETADCIVLYAARQPVFVVDAYTRRVLSRHRWASADASYDELAARFTRALPRDADLFGEYHALIVKLGKEHCRARPRCAGCPLERWLATGRTHGGRR